MTLLKEQIQALPKAELHCHLDGSLRISTILELAENQGVKLPVQNESNLADLLFVENKVQNLEEYLQRFEITLSVMQTAESLQRCTYELIEDAAKENIRYIEIRYSPILHTKDGMTMNESVEAVKYGLEKGGEDFGIHSGIIICGIRNISPKISLQLAEVAVSYKDKGVVGFDLAGAEENFPAKDHMEAFYFILNNNLNVTIHAGEAFGPSSIHQAIHYCGAHRIGHGTRLRENEDLMNYVQDHRITLEVCLTSNWHTRSVPSLEEHPFKYYYDRDIRVTLNTDNRLMSDTTLTKEFHLAHELFNLSLHDFRQLTITAMKSSFLPHDKRKKMIRSIAEELENEFGLMPEFVSQGESKNT